MSNVWSGATFRHNVRRRRRFYFFRRFLKRGESWRGAARGRKKKPKAAEAPTNEAVFESRSQTSLRDDDDDDDNDDNEDDCDDNDEDDNIIRRAWVWFGSRKKRGNERRKVSPAMAV